MPHHPPEPDSSKSVFLNVILYHNFATYLRDHKMYSMYQITHDRISDAVNALYDRHYSNPTAAAQAFGVDLKTEASRRSFKKFAIAH